MSATGFFEREFSRCLQAVPTVSAVYSGLLKVGFLREEVRGQQLHCSNPEGRLVSYRGLRREGEEPRRIANCSLEGF